MQFRAGRPWFLFDPQGRECGFPCKVSVPIKVASDTSFNTLERLNSKDLKLLYEPHREKTGFLPRRKQRRRSASR